MAFSDWVLLALIIAAAVAAMLYARRHPGCKGACDGCRANCSRRQTPGDVNKKEKPPAESGQGR